MCCEAGISEGNVKAARGHRKVSLSTSSGQERHAHTEWLGSRLSYELNLFIYRKLFSCCSSTSPGMWLFAVIGLLALTGNFFALLCQLLMNSPVPSTKSDHVSKRLCPLGLADAPVFQVYWLCSYGGASVALLFYTITCVRKDGKYLNVGCHYVVFLARVQQT